MDSNILTSFMSLLDGDDSPQSGSNNATSAPSTHHRSPCYSPPLNEPYNMYNTAYPPPSFHHFPYHRYHQPTPYPMDFSGGFSQNPPNFPPPYYPLPNNKVHNVLLNEYPYYPYYPPPPTNSNYLSTGSNSTPTGSMVGLGNSEADVDTIPNEGDAEEVVGGVVGGTLTTNVGSGSLKRLHSEAEKGDNETVTPTETPQEGGERPKGRKAIKKRLKEKTNNNIIDVVMKQMNSMLSDIGVVQNALLKFISQTFEDKSHKKMIREEMLKLEQEKLKLEQDRIMMMDTSSMSPDQVAYIQLKRAEILKKRLGESSEP